MPPAESTHTLPRPLVIPANRPMTAAEAVVLSSLEQGEQPLLDHLARRRGALVGADADATGDALDIAIAGMRGAEDPVDFGRFLLLDRADAALRALRELGADLVTLARTGDPQAIALLERHGHVSVHGLR